MNQPPREILSPQVAYRIGFSDALAPDAWSAYHTVGRWPFNQHLQRRLHRAYYRGWLAAYKLKCAVKFEQLNKMGL